nr:hypothetical protein [Tanacetum cinerariifolium]
MVGSPHGFVIHEIKVSKSNEKVTEVRCRELADRQLSDVKVDCFFVRMELFCFVDEVFDSEYVQVQDMLTSGDKSLDLFTFKLSRLFFSLLSSGSSTCWRSYGAQRVYCHNSLNPSPFSLAQALFTEYCLTEC